MAVHATLTGANLHEPKGVASAAANTVYVADGAGSGAWQTLTSSSLNTGSVLNVNKYKHTVLLADVSTASFVLVPVTEDATLNRVSYILSNAITTADATLTFTNSTGPTAMGTLVIDQATSAEGTMDSFSPGANNSFAADTYLKIATDGASDTACPALLFLEWTLT